MAKFTLPPDELHKHYIILRYGRTLSRLLWTISSEYGYFLNDTLCAAYSDLIDEITITASALDENHKLEPADIVGIIAEYSLPDELSYAILASDPYDSIEEIATSLDEACEELQEELRGIALPLGPEHTDRLQSYLRACEDLEQTKARNVEVIAGEVSSAISEISIGSIQNDFTLEYVLQDDLRKRLFDVLREVLVTFKEKAFRSCIVMQRAFLEGLLVYCLERRRDDAMIEFVELNKRRGNPQLHQGRPPMISKWDMGAILEIAKRMDILKSNNIERYCFTINSFRNLVHLHNVENTFRDVDKNACQLGLYTLSVVNEDVKRALITS